jgi:hypothetical protein
VLTGEEFATGFFTHCSGAGGAIGLVCRHLGEEALERKVLKTSSKKNKAKPIYYTRPTDT